MWRDQVHIWSVGVGVDYVIKASLGWSFKDIESNLAVAYEPGTVTEVSSGNHARDFGASLYLPVFETLRRITHTSYKLRGVRPFLIPGIAVSRSNVGGEISYIVAAEADPLPRVGRGGMSLYTGFLFSSEEIEWRLLSYEHLSEAQDLLVRRDELGRIHYTGMWDNIDLWDNVVRGKGAPLLISKTGWELGFLETLYLRRGRYDDPAGAVHYTTKGFGLSLSGALKLFRLYEGDGGRSSGLGFIARHLDVVYDSSRYEINALQPLSGTKFTSLRISVR